MKTINKHYNESYANKLCFKGSEIGEYYVMTL